MEPKGAASPADGAYLTHRFIAGFGHRARVGLRRGQRHRAPLRAHPRGLRRTAGGFAACRSRPGGLRRPRQTVPLAEGNARCRAGRVVGFNRFRRGG